MVLTLSIVTLIGCGPSAREQAATAYVQQMEGLFAENKAITREFINVALGLKKKDLETHEVAIRFADRVVPRAAELAQKVDDVQPGTEALMQVHAGIERAWQIRAEAYAQAAEAEGRRAPVLHTRTERQPRGQRSGRALHRSREHHPRRVSAASRPLSVTVAPSGIGPRPLQWRCDEHALPFCPLADRPPAHWWRPHGPVQLAAGPKARRRLPAAHRGHGPRAFQGRARGAGAARHGVDGAGLGRGRAPAGRFHRQSERQGRYDTYIARMLEEGTAYRCTCSKERLAGVREAAQTKGEKPKYDELPRPQPGPDCGDHVVRFKAPLDGETVVKDLVKGDVTFQNQELDDLIIQRTDGSPTYNFGGDRRPRDEGDPRGPR